VAPPAPGLAQGDARGGGLGQAPQPQFMLFVSGEGDGNEPDSSSQASPGRWRCGSRDSAACLLFPAGCRFTTSLLSLACKPVP